jgi:NAD(P)-dependent dehydrogenase (short-subunit alcohol dehydrogenase family)
MPSAAVGTSSPSALTDASSLRGKVAIVTGSGKENGIGAAIALDLARHGADVAVHYVSDASAARAQKVVKSIQATGAKAVAVQVDIAKPEGAKKLVKEALAGLEAENIDILGK